MVRFKQMYLLLFPWLLWQLRIASGSSCYGGPPPIIINEDADVFIGVLMGVRIEDEASGKDCGEPQREAVEFYESLRWFLSMVNQNSGQVLTRIVKDSYIPGVRIGLKVFDNCGEMDLAEKQLGSLVPELGISECSDDQNEERSVIGLIDCIGISDDTEIHELLKRSYIPVMNVELDTFLPADEVAEAIKGFAKELKWDRVAIIYNPDTYSKDTMRHLSQSADLCIDTYIDTTDSQSASDYASRTNEISAAIVLSPIDEAQEVLEKFAGDWQFLFSQPWTFDDGTFLESFAAEHNLFMVTSNPYEMEPFDSYWTRRKNPQLPQTPENAWILEYLAKLKKCKIPGLTQDSPGNASWLPCHNFNVPESALDKAMRHSRVAPVVHVINTFASLLRKAWDVKCGPSPGYCDDLRNLERVEFFQDFFSKAEFRHDSPGSRIPAGFSSWRRPSSRNELAEVKMALLHVVPAADTFTLELISMYQRNTGISMRKNDFVPRPSQCSRSCPPCASLSHSGVSTVTQSTWRLRNYVARNHQLSKTTTSAKPEILKDLRTASANRIEVTERAFRSSSEEDDDEEDEDEETSEEVLEAPNNVIVANDITTTSEGSNNVVVDLKEPLIDDVSDPSDDVIIPALFPVHKAGPTPLQCSAEINQDAIKDIEAFLWALDQVNSNVEILKGLKIGAVIFDTCSSPLKAAHLVSSIMAKEGDAMLDEIDLNPEKLLAFLAVTSGAEAESAAAILDPARITTISAKERSENRKYLQNKLQVEVPMTVAAKAVMELVHRYGWSYVSLVYGDSDPDSVLGYKLFQELAETSDLCFALVENINKSAKVSTYERIAENIARQSEFGASVVILWLDQEETTNLIGVIEESPFSEQLKNILWVSATGWPSIKHKHLKKSINWISIRPELTIVEDFENRFRSLQPDNNVRNPWFGEFWEQTKNCTVPGCPELPETTTSVIQAVYIIASALARVVQEHCPTPYTGLEHCNPKVLEIRELLHKYLRYTGTDRADDGQGEFHFTEDGFGNTPVEIARLEHQRYQKIGSFLEDKLLVHKTLPIGTVAECKMLEKEACPSCLEKQQNQLLLKESKDNIYLVGLFDVRLKNQDGRWYCGWNVTGTGFQQVEAFLWALDYVSNLTNVSIGGLGLDGCGSHEKRASDVIRILRNPAEFLPDDGQLAGIIVGTEQIDGKLVADVHNRFKIPVVTSSPSTKLIGSSPLFQLSPSVEMIADSLIQILRYFDWSYVSLLCSSESTTSLLLCEEFQSLATNQSIQLAADVTLDVSDPMPDYWDGIALRLQNKSKEGAHVIVTMTTELELEQMLTSLRKIRAAGNSKDPLILLSYEAQSILRNFSDVFSAALVLKDHKRSSDKFTKHLENITYSPKSGNPWTTKFWNQKFNCRGSVCEKFRSGKALPDDPATAETINGVLAFAYGIERVRKDFCPLREGGLCDRMPRNEEFRTRVQNAMEDYDFKDVHGNQAGFYSNGLKKELQLDIVNIYERTSKTIGSCSTKGLTIDKTIIKARDVESIDLVKSSCKGCEKSVIKPWQPSSYMQVMPKEKTSFNLIGFLPYHRQGIRPLSCGSINSVRMFQNLAAVSFALERSHGNSSIPKVGAVIFDSCSRTERAQQRLLSVMGNTTDVIGYSDVIGAVTLSGETAVSLTTVLAEGNIPQFSVPLDGLHAVTPTIDSRDGKWHSVAGNPILQTVPEPEDEVRTIFQIVQKLEWKHLVLFFDDSNVGLNDRDIFVRQLRDTGICIGAQIRVPRPGRAEDPLNLHGLLEAMKPDLPGMTAAIFLLHDTAQVERVLSAIIDTGLAAKFLVVANHAWGKNNEILHENSVHELAGVITVSMETYEVREFQDYIFQLSLDKHGSIPKDWFEEFYQNHFECQLEHSRVAQKMFQKKCAGNEKFRTTNMEYDPYVYHTITAVETFIHAVDEFLHNYCPAGIHAAHLSDCGPAAHERFSNLLSDIARRRDFSQKARGLQIWNVHFRRDFSAYRDSNSGFYQLAGICRDSQLELDTSKLKLRLREKAAVQCREGPCLAVCGSPSSTYTTKYSRVPEMPANFYTPWGVVTIAFSLLGSILVLSCGIYFIRNLPKRSANTVLTYATLTGLLLLYVTSIFFLLSPNETSCGLRRFFLGISYCTVFAGLLVRSVHSWRRITHGGANTESVACSVSSTQSFELTDTANVPGLLLSTLTLIAVQVILISAWLIFKPPAAVTISTGEERCVPADNFESELLISLVYPMILLFTATVFSFCVYRSSDAPKDSRAMLACCLLLVGSWISWTLVATQGGSLFREPAVVIGIIACAKIVLFVLYGRQVYDIAVHRQEARNLAVLSQFTTKALQPSLHTSFESGHTTMSAIYNPEMDGHGASDSGAASAEDAALGLCLGLATGQLSRRNSCRSQGRRKFLERDASPPGSFEEGLFNSRMVPSPIFPAADRLSLRSRCRTPDEDREFDSDDFHLSRSRSINRSHSRRNSMELPAAHPPLVRRVGSRQMLVLGDEASVHGRVSKI